MKQQAVLDVVMQTRIACFQVLLARSALEVADEEERQLEGHAHDAKQIYGQGLVPYNDLLKSQVSLAQACQNRVSAASKLRVAVSALFEEAIKKKPELRRLNVAMEQAGLPVRIAKSSYYPQVYLVGSYEQTGNNPSADNNDFGNDHNAILGFQVTWPFFEWGKTRPETTKAFIKSLPLSRRSRRSKTAFFLRSRMLFKDLGSLKKTFKPPGRPLFRQKKISGLPTFNIGMG